MLNSKIRMSGDKLYPHLKTALATAMCGARDDYDSKCNFIMLHQGETDVTGGRMSVFSFDQNLELGTHSRVEFNSQYKLPLNPHSNDHRAYMSVADLDALVKWLKTMPKGDVSLKWGTDSSGDTLFYATFDPDRSQRTFEPLTMTYPDLRDWVALCKRAFNQGRFAYRNAMNYNAVRQFSTITTRPLTLNWLAEIYEGRSVDMTPFDGGSMLYIRSDFNVKLEAVCTLPYPCRSNVMKRKED